ncbi:hypothetical protein [Azohydromonas aeria]|uniref:hypothetical protein n=1 Tax=Azohydromonas aeria TaxID=2590212 RepID=UPI0012F9FABE|nr:hypothetical protein [Azohydromonas aeria]
MKCRLTLGVAFSVAINLAGCAIVSSERVLPGSQSMAQGTVYMLPLARVPVVLYAYKGQIFLDMSEPFLSSDPDHTYVARRVSNPFSTDNVSINVDPTTGFLVSVNATAKDETLQILEKLLLPKAPVQEKALDSEAVEIFSAELNPANPVELQRASQSMTSNLRQFLEFQNSSCTEPAAVCDEYKLLAREMPTVQLSGHPASARSTELVPPMNASPEPIEVPQPKFDCSIGLCYRQPQPFMMTAMLAGRSKSVVLVIPNAAPVLALPIERHAFVTTVHDITFENGALKTVTVDRPSSALAFVSSPLALASGVIKSVVDPLTGLFKIDTSGQYEAGAKERIAKNASATETAKEVNEARKEAGTGEAKILISLKIGTRREEATSGLSSLQGSSNTTDTNPTGNLNDRNAAARRSGAGGANNRFSPGANTVRPSSDGSLNR